MALHYLPAGNQHQLIFRIDVFSSIGVLLAARTLGLCTSQDALKTADVTILKCGMSFLRSVSEHSVLAERYVSLLERYQSAFDENPTMPTAGRISSETTSGPNTGSEERGHMPEPPADSLHPGFLPDACLDNFGVTNGIENIQFPDPNHFLFGMGLPQEFLSTDWSFLEPRINEQFTI